MVSTQLSPLIPCPWQQSLMDHSTPAPGEAQTGGTGLQVIGNARARAGFSPGLWPLQRCSEGVPSESVSWPSSRTQPFPFLGSFPGSKGMNSTEPFAMAMVCSQSLYLQFLAQGHALISALQVSQEALIVRLALGGQEATFHTSCLLCPSEWEPQTKGRCPRGRPGSEGQLLRGLSWVWCSLQACRAEAPVPDSFSSADKGWPGLP